MIGQSVDLDLDRLRSPEVDLDLVGVLLAHHEEASVELQGDGHHSPPSISQSPSAFGERAPRRLVGWGLAGAKAGADRESKLRTVSRRSLGNGLSDARL